MAREALVDVTKSGSSAFAAGGGGSPGGTVDQIQANNGAGGFAGLANVAGHGGDLILTGTTPTTPPAGSLKHFVKNVAGRILPAVVGSSGLDVSLQPHIGRNKIGRWTPGGNATTAPLGDGITAPTAIGTATARNVATTNLLNSMRRLGYVSAATAPALCGIRTGVAQFWRGNAANLGGFHFITRFAISDAATVAGARMFVGLSATVAAPTNVEPNTLANTVGVAQISTSTNLQIITRDATAAQTIDLGVNFPCVAALGHVYELALFAPPGGSSIGYRVENLSTGSVAQDTLTTNIPVNTTLMGITMWRTNNASNVSVGLDLISMYVETDY